MNDDNELGEKKKKMKIEQVILLKVIHIETYLYQ